jgi:cytochrome c5
MSDHDHSNDHDHVHTGPIKTPTQLVWTVFYSFFGPVLIIIALVYFVVSAVKPATSSDQALAATSGVLAADTEQAVAKRIEKIGSIEVRDANRELKSGEEVYKAQCVTCHGSGVAGAPKFGNAAAWGARIKTGYAALLNSALKGKGAMGAQGGGDFDDIEIGRAVVHMANAAGGKLPVPQAQAAPAPEASVKK